MYQMQYNIIPTALALILSGMGDELWMFRVYCKKLRLNSRESTKKFPSLSYNGGTFSGPLTSSPW